LLLLFFAFRPLRTNLLMVGIQISEKISLDLGTQKGVPLDKRTPICSLTSGELTRRAGRFRQTYRSGARYCLTSVQGEGVNYLICV
jgi:hypothetical protein